MFQRKKSNVDSGGRLAISIPDHTPDRLRRIQRHQDNIERPVEPVGQRFGNERLITLGFDTQALIYVAQGRPQ